MGKDRFERSLIMRILIIGAAGMLGHKLYQVYRERYDVYATTRQPYSAYARYGIFDENRIISGTDADNFDTLIRAVGQVKPDVIINCVGIIKQLKASKDPIPSIRINSLLPHQLADLSAAAHARFIHISTDCVFNGQSSMYKEDTPSDAEDLYGRTKYLGEVDYPHALTLRTSIIGRELSTRSGLVEWFLSNPANSTVKGFRQAIYTGFTTLALAEIMAEIIDNHPELNGLYQVSSEPINKYDLLHLVKDAFDVNINIEPDDNMRIDRSLDSTKFRETTGFQPPAWENMIQAMASDPTPYENWK